MSHHACASCEHAHRTKYAPRRISACETSFPLKPNIGCEECGISKTDMKLCLACALETSRCQNCGKRLQETDDSFLAVVSELRTQLRQSLAEHQSRFEQAVAPFKAELGTYLARTRQASDQFEAAAQGLKEHEGQALYTELRETQKRLRREFAAYKQYASAKDVLDRHTKLDIETCDKLVESALSVFRSRQDLMRSLSMSIAFSTSFASQKPPEPLDSSFITFALTQMSEAERTTVQDAIDKRNNPEPIEIIRLPDSRFPDYNE